MTINQRLVTASGMLLAVLAQLSLHAAITDITQENQLNKFNKPTVIKFYGSWCHVCKDIEGAYQELSEDRDCKGINFCAVDIDKMPELAKQYKIRGVPTFVYLDKNKNNVHEVIGVSNIKKFKEERKKEIDQVLRKKSMMAKMKKSFKDSYQYVANKTKSLFARA
jgi:thiol-disulfide isomerase/thioredoxin